MPTGSFASTSTPVASNFSITAGWLRLVATYIAKAASWNTHASFSGRVMERTRIQTTAHYMLVWVHECSSPQEQLDDRSVSILRSDQQRRRTILRKSESCEHSTGVLHKRNTVAHTTHLTLCTHVGSHLHQVLDHRRVALARRHHQRRRAILPKSLRISEPVPSHHLMPIKAHRCCNVHIDAFLLQQPHHLRQVPLVCCVKQLRIQEDGLKGVKMQAVRTRTTLTAASSSIVMLPAQLMLPLHVSAR